jgi:hypothetical protein
MASIDKQNTLIEYWLDNIKILKFNLSEIEDLDVDNDRILLTINLAGDFDKEKSRVQIITEVKISKEISEDNKIEIAELKVKTIFGIQNVDILDDEGKVLLPKNLLNQFNAISVSTTRGILFSKFQGTNIDNFIIPLIDKQQLTGEFMNEENIKVID